MEARSQRPVYPSDLTDAEWAWIKEFIPAETGGGRHRDTDMRRVVNAILYLLRSGCSWRMLPKDFPPYTTVYEYYSRCAPKTARWCACMMPCVGRCAWKRGVTRNRVPE